MFMRDRLNNKRTSIKHGVTSSTATYHLKARTCLPEKLSANGHGDFDRLSESLLPMAALQNEHVSSRRASI